MTQRSVGAFLQAYSFVRKQGWLANPVVRWTFVESYFLYKRLLEDPFQKLLRRHPGILGNADILDVGANIGYTATVFARHAAPGAKVYAFEPESFNFTILSRIARKARGSIIPIQAAIGREPGETEIWVNESSHADHRIVTGRLEEATKAAPRERVSMESIDNFTKSHGIGKVSFIKIDVQGFETAVCEGMEETLARNPGIKIAVEYMPSAMEELGFDPKGLLAWFEARGLSFMRIGGDGQLKSGLDPLSDDGYVDLLFSRDRGPRSEMRQDCIRTGNPILEGIARSW